MKNLSWVGALLGGASGAFWGFIANSSLASMTDGLWSVDKGAPALAIAVIIIIPAIFGFVYGLIKNAVIGIVAGVCSAFATAIIDYIVCIIIGLFVSGTALAFVVCVFALFALLAGPGRILVIFISD